MIKNLQIKTCVIEMSKMKKLGIIGIGNWGKNLIRDASKISYVKKCSSQGNPKNINWLKKATQAQKPILFVLINLLVSFLVADPCIDSLINFLHYWRAA